MRRKIIPSSAFVAFKTTMETPFFVKDVKHGNIYSVITSIMEQSLMLVKSNTVAQTVTLDHWMRKPRASAKVSGGMSLTREKSRRRRRRAKRERSRFQSLYALPLMGVLMNEPIRMIAPIQV
jgi:hypothetical protein